MWSDDAKGLLIDLGREAVVHRVYLMPGEGATKGYAQVRLTFAAKPDGDPLATTRSYLTPACECWKVREQRQKLLASGTSDFLPLNKVEADLKFNPVAARYLRIEGATPIAELEVYGSVGRAARVKSDAVVLPANAAEVLQVAAEDLRYYVGELTGRPIPIIDPGQEGEYPRTICAGVGTHERSTSSASTCTVGTGRRAAKSFRYASYSALALSALRTRLRKATPSMVPKHGRMFRTPPKHRAPSNLQFFGSF